MVDYSNLFSEDSSPNDSHRFSGYVMSGDFKVARVDNNCITDIIDSTRCPLYLMRTKDFEGWLLTRCIDVHRTNSRVLRKALRLQNVEEIELVLKVHGVTVTDNYWCKEDYSNLVYEDVLFDNDDLADLALLGIFEELDYDKINTPELTNIGSFEKCWKYDGYEWNMIKKANLNEMYSELYIEKLGNEFGYDMAEYSYYSKDSVCSHDFTKGKFNLEPLHSLVGEDMDYEVVTNVLLKFGDSFVRDYFKIIFMDALVMNPDRHEFNLGLLRDRESGRVLKLTPNFDNNLALISRGYPKSLPTEKNLMISDFVSIIRKYPNYFNLPRVDKNVIARADSNMSDEFREIDWNFICKFIMNNYKLIKKGLGE